MEFYGLIGEKLGHSLSPQIHQMYFSLTGKEGAYRLLEIPPEKLSLLPEAIRLFRFRGLNVTIPYKQAILPYLDEIDPLAREAGAVNTLCLQGDRLVGCNTDVLGLSRALLRMEVSLSGAKATVLGSGGAAKAAVLVLLKGGAREITVVSRQPEGRTHPDPRVRFSGYDAPLAGDLLINATPVGMFPHAGYTPVGAEVLSRFDALMDLIYNPEETEFLRLGREMGKNVSNGLYMLIEQALASEEIWQGEPVPEGICEAIGRALREGGPDR